MELGDEDADAFAANVGYHFTDTALSMLFARVGVVQTDISGDDDTSWNGTLGIVPIPRLFFGTDFTEDDWDPNLTARYAGKLPTIIGGRAASPSRIPMRAIRTSASSSTTTSPSFKRGRRLQHRRRSLDVRAEAGLPHGFALLGRVYGDDGGEGFGLTLTWRDL